MYDYGELFRGWLPFLLLLALISYHTFSIEQIVSGLTDCFLAKKNIMLVQAKAFYLFLLLIGSHGEVILGISVDAKGPDLDGASTLYSRPGPPNLFAKDNKEVRDELIKAAISSSFELVAHFLANQR
jgi:hypothetical protein